MVTVLRHVDAADQYCSSAVTGVSWKGLLTWHATGLKRGLPANEQPCSFGQVPDQVVPHLLY